MKLKSSSVLPSLLCLAPSCAFAGPISAMSCVNESTKTFVTIDLSTDLFAPAAPSRILAYDLVVGKLGSDGEVASKLEFAGETNIQVFDDDAQARDWVAKNPVTVPTADDPRATAVQVDFAKKQVTIVDANGASIETLDCLKN